MTFLYPLTARPGKRYNLTTNGLLNKCVISGKMQSKFYAVFMKSCVILLFFIFMEFLAISLKICNALQFNGGCSVNEPILGEIYKLSLNRPHWAHSVLFKFYFIYFLLLFFKTEKKLKKMDPLPLI